MLAHHVDLIYGNGTQNQRFKHEGRATNRILEWLRAKGYGPRLIVHRSTFQYGTVFVSQDIYVTGFFVGLLFRHYKQTHIFVSGTNAEDATVRNSNWPIRNERRLAIIRETAGRPIEVEWPNRAQTKSQVAASIPSDLLALTWYCRRPKGDDPQPCGHCPPCRHLNSLPHPASSVASCPT